MDVQSNAPVVIGITGPTRCGKGRLTKMLARKLEQEKGWSQSNGQIKVIGQDSYWTRAVTITLANGQTRISEEAAECHDFERMIEDVQSAINEVGTNVVIVEGFTSLHDARVAQLCDHIFLLDVSRENTIKRRSDKAAHNTNRLSVQQCEDVVWPAHEQYLIRAAEVLDSVDKTWVQLDANDNGLEMLDSHALDRTDKVFEMCFKTETHYMYLESHLNGLVLDIDLGRTTPGAEVVMWTKESGSNQKWCLKPAGCESKFYLESELNALVLTVREDRLVMWPRECGEAAHHQVWRLTTDEYLESGFNDQGLVLDIDMAIDQRGAKIVLRQKEGGSNQKWRWVSS